MSITVDMADPRVAAMMGGQTRTRDLVQIAGDDGVGQAINMASGKHETRVVYKDFVLTVDVYAIPGEPLQVHLICPGCRKQLRVTQDRKHIDWHPATGELSISPFQCTWEKSDDAHVPGLVAGGGTLCKWTVGIDKNVAKDA